MASHTITLYKLKYSKTKLTRWVWSRSGPGSISSTTIVRRRWPPSVNKCQDHLRLHRSQLNNAKMIHNLFISVWNRKAINNLQKFCTSHGISRSVSVLRKKHSIRSNNNHSKLSEVNTPCYILIHWYSANPF